MLRKACRLSNSILDSFILGNNGSAEWITDNINISIDYDNATILHEGVHIWHFNLENRLEFEEAWENATDKKYFNKHHEEKNYDLILALASPIINLDLAEDVAFFTEDLYIAKKILSSGAVHYDSIDDAIYHNYALKKIHKTMGSENAAARLNVLLEYGFISKQDYAFILPYVEYDYDSKYMPEKSILPSDLLGSLIDEVLESIQE